MWLQVTCGVVWCACGWQGDRELFLFADLHGHSKKRSIFLYGNCSGAATQAQRLGERMLPWLMQAASGGTFAYDNCKYKVEPGKCGSARVVVALELKATAIITMAVLTMAVLTMAILTMAILALATHTMAILTMLEPQGGAVVHHRGQLRGACRGPAPRHSLQHAPAVRAGL